MRGKNMLLMPAFACLGLALSPSAWAQDSASASSSGPAESARVLRIAEFGGAGIQSGEASALQGLITSNVVALSMFRVIDSQGQELALQEAETAVQLGTAKEIAPLVADYILSAKVDRVGTFIVFTMGVTKASTGEERSVSDTFTSENDVLLSVRRLTRSLFEKQYPASSPVSAAQGRSAPRPSANPAPGLPLLSGTWKGDKNVDRVTLLPDGRGFAVLDSGVRMSLKAKIDGALVIIAQDQPNSPDFYRPSLNLKSARMVAQGARPWRWSFSLSSDGSSLIGVKESVFVTVNENGNVSLDNNYVRDAVWTRSYR
jgi:hypothetical protein